MNLRERTIRLSGRALLGLAALVLAGTAASRPLPGAVASGTIVDADTTFDLDARFSAPADAATLVPAQRGSVSLNEAVEIAQRRYSGTVVRAETTTRDGRTVHEIRILAADGRVRTVRIDAASGEER